MNGCKYSDCLRDAGTVSSWKRLRKWMLIRRGPLLLLCGFVIIISLVICVFFKKESDSAKNQYLIERQIKYSFTLRNKSNHLVKNSDFYIHAPVKQTSYQLCKNFVVSHPYNLIEDELGNQIVVIHFEAFSPYSSQVVNIKANLLLSEKPNHIDANKDMFVNPEKYVESGHSDILELAKSLQGSSVQDTSLRIYNWVLENIKYSGYSQQPRGALYALNEKKGDCTEYMNLFVALCRANSVPSRGVGGYICFENLVLKPAEYHNWAEFSVNQKWQISDPQNKRFCEYGSKYIAMNIIGKKSKLPTFDRFYITDDRLSAKMN